MMSEPSAWQADEERLSRLGGSPRREMEILDEAWDRDAGAEKPKRRHTTNTSPRSYTTVGLTEEERLWAAVAHASAWITLLGGLVTLGGVVPVSIFIPLIIYFVFRHRSDYVTFHALQAFVVQLIGTLGALLLLLVGGLVWGVGLVICLVAMLVLIGFVLIIVWAFVGAGLIGGVVLLPLLMVFYGSYAAFETYRGRDYRVPLVARWVDRQIMGGLLNPL